MCSWLRKISICKSHGQLERHKSRTKPCHLSNTCPASCVSSWFTAPQPRVTHAGTLENNGYLPPALLCIQPATASCQVSLELPFLSLLPLHYGSLLLLPQHHAYLPTALYPLSTPTAGQSGSNSRLAHLSPAKSPGFSQGMVLPPREYFGNLGGGGTTSYHNDWEVTTADEGQAS